MVGVLGDRVAQAPFAEEFLLVFLEMKDDFRAAGFAGHVAGSEGAVAVGFPLNGFLGLGARLAGDDRHAVRDDEGGVKAHAELADELGVLLLFARELGHEGFGARLGDGAEVFVGFGERHADAVVGDGERARFRIGLDADREDRIIGRQFGLREREKAQLVDGVGRIGNEFAEEHFLVRVKGLGKKTEELGDLGLKTMDFLCHF